jgi:hypothetical protein
LRTSRVPTVPIHIPIISNNLPEYHAQAGRPESSSAQTFTEGIAAIANLTPTSVDDLPDQRPTYTFQVFQPSITSITSGNGDSAPSNVGERRLEGIVLRPDEVSILFKE